MHTAIKMLAIERSSHTALVAALVWSFNDTYKSRASLALAAPVRLLVSAAALHVALILSVAAISARGSLASVDFRAVLAAARGAWTVRLVAASAGSLWLLSAFFRAFAPRRERRGTALRATVFRLAFFAAALAVYLDAAAMRSTSATSVSDHAASPGSAVTTAFRAPQ